MAPTAAATKIGDKMLWSLLSGACRPVQPEAVGPAFQEAADRIIDGPGEDDGGADEGLYAAHCLEHVVRQSLDADDAYAELFGRFLETFDTGAGRVKAALLRRLAADDPTTAPPEPLVEQPLALRSWWAGRVRRRLVLVQALIFYGDTAAARLDAADWLRAARCCSPSAGQEFQDREALELAASLLHLQTVLLLKWMTTLQDGSKALLDVAVAVEEELRRLAESPTYSPVLLRWMLLNCGAGASASSQALGERAVEQGVLHQVACIASDVVVKGRSPLKEAVCWTLSLLVGDLVTAFEPQHLGADTGRQLRAATAALLAGRRAADHLWTDQDAGLRLVWDEALQRLPLNVAAVVDLAVPVACTSPENGRKVVEELHQLSAFSEPLEAVAEASLQRLGSSGSVTLLQAHYPYRSVGSKDVVIPRGCHGVVRAKVVRWQVRTSFWDVALAEMEALRQQSALGQSAVQPATLGRVDKILSLVPHLIPQMTEAGMDEHVARLERLVLALTERWSTLPEVLARCLTCLAALVDAGADARLLAARLHQTQVLPGLQSLAALSDVEALMEAAIVPGVVGTALAGKECPQGTYPITVAFLKLVNAFVKADAGGCAGLAASGLLVLREVVPAHLTWQFATADERDAVTGLCLQWLQRALQHAPPADDAAAAAATFSLQEVCARTMLERRGGWQGDSLLRLTAYGSAAAEAQLLRQANWADNQAPGRLLLRHIRQSLAVFDLLFRADHRLRATHPPVQDAGDETTAAAAAAEPLAPTALESQLLARSVQAGQPTLVSVLAHYGWCHFDPALSILALKVLRWCAEQGRVSLLACLGDQAAAVRSAWLTALESPLDDAGAVDAVLRLLAVAVRNQPGLVHLLVNGEDRCLSAVASLVTCDQSPTLRLAATRFVHQLWFQRSWSAVEYLKGRPGFWTSLCRPLAQPPANQQADTWPVAALVFQIVAIELYNTAGQLEADLQAAVDRLVAGPHLVDWSDLVLSRPQSEELNELVSGWSELLVMLAYHGPATAADLRRRLGRRLLDALAHRVHQPEPGAGRRLLTELAELHWMLLRGARAHQKEPLEQELVASTGRLLTAVSQQKLPSLAVRFQAAVLCSAVDTVRHIGQPDRHIFDALEDWVRPAAVLAQACLLESPQRPTDVVTCLSLSLLRHLVLVLRQDASSRWLKRLQEQFMLQCLISMVQQGLQRCDGWGVVESALGVLHAAADTADGSRALASLQLEHFLWLPLEAVHQARPSVYRLGLQLCTVLLQRQRHFFLDQALALVGVHRELLVAALAGAGRGQQIALAVDVMALLCQLSEFQQTWRLQHLHSMQAVLQASASALYSAVAALIRPNWLQNRVQLTHQGDGAAATTAAAPSDDGELLQLVCQGLALLHCYSPPLGALLTQDGIDIARWERHLDPSFGTPAPSNEGDAGAPANTPPLSFGTLNAVASHCLRQLAARPPPPSAAAAAADADADAAAAPRRREQLTLVLELALSLLLSQALLFILDPRLSAHEKQLLKRELGAELGSFVESLRRQAQRGLRSPATVGRQLSTTASSSTSTTTAAAAAAGDPQFLRLVGHIVQRIFK